MGGVEELKRQHDKIHVGVAAMAAVRDRFEELDRDMIYAAIGRILEFFRDDVSPHARAEESVLYPEVARLLNLHLSNLLVHGHREKDRLVADLVGAQSALAAGSEVPSKVRDTLTALINLMRSHLRQEDEVLLTMLAEHLSSTEADALFERMEQASDAAMAPWVAVTGQAKAGVQVTAHSAYQGAVTPLPLRTASRRPRATRTP